MFAFGGSLEPQQKLPVMLMPRPTTALLDFSLEQFLDTQLPHPNPIAQNIARQLDLPPVIPRHRRLKPGAPETSIRRKTKPPLVETLRRELERSTKSTAQFEEKLRTDVESVLHILRHPTARQYARRLAVRRFVASSQKTIQRWLFRHFKRWSRATIMLRNLERKHLAQKDKAAGILFKVLRKNWIAKPTSRCLRRWGLFVLAEREREAREAREFAAVTAQRIARGIIARDGTKILRMERLEKQQQAASILIQSVVRCPQAKRRVAALRQRQREAKAATKMTSLARGRRARAAVTKRRKFAVQIAGATVIQGAFRRWKSRKLRRASQEARRQKMAATRIEQCIRRYFFGILRAEKARDLRLRHDSATEIQRHLRGVRGRGRARRIKKKRDKRRKKETRAALKLQTWARTVVKRRWYLEEIAVVREVRRVQNDAATVVQRILGRGIIIKIKTRQKIQKRRERLISDAASCLEIFDGTAGLFYYRNDKTRTAEWEPPKTGYKRRDGYLVLADGTIRDDPTDVATDARKAAIAANAAADDLLGRLSTEATKPLAHLRAFLAQRLAIDGFDVRAVRDQRFDDLCDVLQDVSTDLAGRLLRFKRQDSPESVVDESGQHHDPPTASPIPDATTNVATYYDDDDVGASPEHDAQQQQYEPTLPEEEVVRDEQPGWNETEQFDTLVQHQPDSADDYNQGWGDYSQYYDNSGGGDDYYDNQQQQETALYYDDQQQQQYDDPAGTTTTTLALWYQYADDSGYPYYYNTATEESTYDRPDCDDIVVVEDGGEADPSSADYYIEAPENWIQSQDEYGRWFWYNTATGETRYDDAYYYEEEA